MHEENSFLREENNAVTNTNAVLNQDIEELQEKLKENPDGINNLYSGNHLRVHSHASTRFSSSQSINNAANSDQGMDF